MPREVIVCRCDCGCGNVTKDISPICINCQNEDHAFDPVVSDLGFDLDKCQVCDGFQIFDRSVKMFKCGPFCKKIKN